MIGHLGVPELLVILAIFMLLFGVTKLPKLGKGLGEGIRFFKEGLRGVNEQVGDPSSVTPEGGRSSLPPR